MYSVQGPNSGKLVSAVVDACHVTELDVMVMTLPAEVGFVLMMDIYKASPFEVGFEKSIDWSKDFIGKEAAAKVRDEAAIGDTVTINGYEAVLTERVFI